LSREDLTDGQVAYVKYRPGSICLVGYHLHLAGQVILALAAAHPGDARDELHRAGDLTGVPGPLGPGRLVLEDHAVVVSTFPNDRRLQGLHCLADAQARRTLFRELLPDRPDLWESPVDCVVYKPELRYVARLSGAGADGAVLKVYNEKGYEPARRAATALPATGSPRLSPCLGCCDRERILAFGWLPGRLLSEAMADADFKPQVLAGVGAALAEFHAQEPEGLSPLTREAEAAALADVAHGIGCLCPQLDTRARELARRLGAWLLGQAPDSRPVHGDLHAKQVLLAGDAVAVLDLDLTVRGDPLLDVGSLIAYLQRDVLWGQLASARAETFREILLEGYAYEAGWCRPGRINRYTAARLFKLGLKPFRQRQPDWPALTERLLDRVEELLRTA
jgi:tRNA A-37 threonylcarbamoyl transferase component Bud32